MRVEAAFWCLEESMYIQQNITSTWCSLVHDGHTFLFCKNSCKTFIEILYKAVLCLIIWFSFYFTAFIFVTVF